MPSITGHVSQENDDALVANSRTSPQPAPEAGTADAHQVVARIGKNAIFLSVSFLSQIASQVLILSIIGRLAGVEKAGIWTYVIAFIDPFQVIMDLGTTRLLVPEIARRREETDLLLGNALTLGVLVGTPVLATLAIVANLDILHHSETTILELYLGGLAVLLFNLALSIRSALRAFNRFDLEAINSVLAAVVLVVGSFGVLFLQAPFISLFAVYALTYLIALLNGWRLYNRHLGRIRFQYDPAVLRQILGKSWVFMFVILLFRAYMRIDILILRYFCGTVAVGYYGLVTALFYRFDIVTRLITTSILPSMSRSYVAQRGQIGRYLNLALKVQILAALPMTVVGFILARPIIFLLYGSGYEPSVVIFQFLMTVLFLRLINRTFTVTLTAMDLQHRTLVALALSVIFNITVNLFLIPRFEALGATLTAMASEVVLCVLAYLSLTATARRSIRWETLARPLPSILILTPPLYVMRDWPLLFSLPVSLVIYGLALFLVRALSVTEVQALTNLMESINILPVPLRRRLAALMLARAHD
jgi:O-antigen/teichoic acid export membrane protein